MAKADALGYPLVIRPSYVLGGRAMRIVHAAEDVQRFMADAARASELGPILIDRYLQDAIEVDVDVRRRRRRRVASPACMEHIEEAGIHSGDSACSLPPYSLPPAIVREIERQAEALARALEVRGLMNVQMAIKDGEVFVLEVNPRASRTVPFVAKAIGRPVAKIAARVMAGERLADFPLRPQPDGHVAVKEAVFPFARFPGVDLLLGPGDEVDRRGDGPRPRFRRGLRQVAARRRHRAAGAGHGVHLGARARQARRRSSWPGACTSWASSSPRPAAPPRRSRRPGCRSTVVNKVHEGRPHIVDLIKDGAHRAC